VARTAWKQTLAGIPHSYTDRILIEEPVTMTAPFEAHQIAARAVHMIASIEPALDAAIELFARDVQTLSEIPARETILRELHGVIQEVIGADNKVLPAEISSYSQLLEVVDVANQQLLGSHGREHVPSTAYTQDGLSVAKLLARLDGVEGTNFSHVYQVGVAALVRHIASADGEITSEEYALMDRYEPKTLD
jgi:uncharacterized tellurite resistance protein B-like protein